MIAIGLLIEFADIIYVVPNSRVNSFGFLAGQEVHEDATANVNAGESSRHQI